MSKNLSFLSGRKGLDNNLFEKLGALGDEKGSPDKEDIQELAREFLMGDANLWGTATFYDFLKPENRGKKVYLCSGSVCKMAGTQDSLKAKLTGHFPEEEIGEMCCLGRCHENSAFQYEGRNYSGADIDHFTKEDQDPSGTKLKVDSIGQQVLTGPELKTGEAAAIISNMLERSREAVLEEIKRSGLRGRGGAGFPIGLKLESCYSTESDSRFIVCNADEGDPGAFSDRYIMEYQGAKLVTGMIIAGYAAGAQQGVVYIRAEYPESIEALEKVVNEFHVAGILGNDRFPFQLKLIKARGSYICGEETALLSSLEGQRPEVRVRPPFPTVEGLFNKPTAVNNVETLAFLPFILSNGGEAFSKIGTSDSTGTKLLSLDSFFNAPGLYEVEMGTPLKDVIHNLGGGFREPVKAMHIGGPLGGLVPVSKLSDLKVDFGSFKNNGFLLGHASIICIPEEYPIIEYLEHLFEFTAEESCGKCFPCRLGSVRGAELLNKARTEDLGIDRELFNDLIETLEKGSLCALGGGLPLPVKNALQYFDGELAKYFQEA